MTLAGRLTALFEDWHARRLDAVAARFAPDAVWHFSAVTKPPARGREEIEAFLRQYAAKISASRLRVLRTAETGNTLFLEAVEDLETADGYRVVLPYAGVVTFRGMLIADWRDYFDRQSLEDQMAGTTALGDHAQELIALPISVQTA